MSKAREYIELAIKYEREYEEKMRLSGTPLTEYSKGYIDGLEKALLGVELDERDLEGYRAWSHSVNEALNTGDGVYRP